MQQSTMARCMVLAFALTSFGLLLQAPVPVRATDELIRLGNGEIESVESETPDDNARSLMLIDDLEDWFNVPVNCGIVANPVPSGHGFYKGGPAEYWRDGRQPASGPFIAWEDHAYWTGAAQRWTSHEDNNWAIWAPQLPGDGWYTVEVFVPRMGTGENFDTRAATYEIQTGGSPFSSDEEKTISQLDNVGRWVELGTWEFTNTDMPGGCGGGPTVTLRDVTSDLGSAVTFDAVRWTEAEEAEPDFVYVEFETGCDVNFEVGERVAYYHYSHAGGVVSIYRQPGGTRLAQRATAPQVRMINYLTIEEAPGTYQLEALNTSTGTRSAPCGYTVEAPEEDIVFVEFEAGCDLSFERGERVAYYHYSELGGVVSIYRQPGNTRLAQRATAPQTRTINYYTIDEALGSYHLEALNTTTGARSDACRYSVVEPEPTDEVTVDFADGCGLTFTEGDQTTIHHYSRTGGTVEIRRLPDNRSLFRGSSPAGQRIGRSYTVAGPPGSYSLEARNLDTGVVSSRCQYSVVAPPAQPKVAILVHGWQGLAFGGGNQCTRIPRKDIQGTGEWDKIGELLHANDYTVYVASWRSSPESTSSIAEARECLRQQVEWVKDREKADKVTLVAHSMGGLVSRAYIENASLRRGDVDTLVTLGSPHLGVNSELLLRLVRALNPKSRLTCLDNGDPGTCQLSFEYVTQVFNPKHPPDLRTRYHAIGGTGGIRTVLKHLWGPIPNDGIVPLVSAQGLNSRLTAVSSWQTGDVHAAALAFGVLFLDDYFNSDVSVDCLRVALGISSDAGRCKAGAIALEQQNRETDPDGLDQELADAAEMTPMIRGQLEAWESREARIIVDGSHAAFIMSWTGGAVEVSLTDPSGNKRRASDMGDAYSELRIPNGPVLAEMVVPGPAQGEWIVELHETSGRTTDYSVFAALESGLDLTLDLPGAVSAGDTTTLRANLKDAASPIDDAAVIAYVTQDGGRETPIVLRAAGGGRYAADYSVSGNQSLLPVRAVAASRPGAARAYERETEAMLVVEPGSIVPPPASGSLANLSTRCRVEQGDDVMIGGFILRGGAATVAIRAIGPDLASRGVVGALEDPSLEVHHSGELIAANDNWQSSNQAQEISLLQLAPSDPRESVILKDLEEGEYTAIVRGNAGLTGVALVEAFKVSGPGELVNLSTRCKVQAGDDVMIGGFILRDRSTTLVVRALGPALAARGVLRSLADPTIQIYSGNRLISENDNWADSRLAAAIRALGLAPAHGAEPAVMMRLAPGPYTAIVRGAQGQQGVGLVEVFRVNATDADPYPGP